MPVSQTQPKLIGDQVVDFGELIFGTDRDYWFTYNHDDTRFEFWTADSDGAGTPGKVFWVTDGEDGMAFSGTFYPDNDDTDTYIHSDAADKMKFVVGGVTMLDMVEGATDYLEIPTAALFQWASSVELSAATDGKLVITDDAGQGIMLDLTIDSQVTLTDEAAGDLTLVARNASVQGTSSLGIVTATSVDTTTLEADTLNVIAKDVRVPLTDCHQWDDLAVNVRAAGVNDDLGLVTGTPGTSQPSLQTGDVKATNSTRKAGFLLKVPADYKAGGTLTLRVFAGMVTTIADTSCTVDIQAWVPDYANGDGTVSTDLCETAAQDINSLTFANKDFVIDDDQAGHALAPGDVIQVVLSIIYNDGATGTAVIGCVRDIQLRVTA